MEDPERSRSLVVSGDWDFWWFVQWGIGVLGLMALWLLVMRFWGYNFLGEFESFITI